MPEPPGFSKRSDNMRFNQNAPEFVPDLSFFSDNQTSGSSEIL